MKNWTNEKPTRYGYYWYQSKESHESLPNDVPRIVSVYRGYKNLFISDGPTRVTFTGNESEYDVSKMNGLWYGPIFPPEGYIIDSSDERYSLLTADEKI